MYVSLVCFVVFIVAIYVYVQESSMQTLKDRWKDQRSTLSNEVQDLEEENKKLEDSLEETSDDVEEYKDTVDSQESSIESLKSDKSKLEKEVKSLEDDVQELRTLSSTESGGNIETKSKEEPKPSTKESSKDTELANASEDKSGETMYMEATAYTAYCDGCSGITSTGIDLRSNPNQKVIAVDPNVVPIGSKVHVEGYGTAIAGDVGGDIKGNRIDIFVPTKKEAYSWGRKQVQITVLD